jgi:ABC-2 type transport system ATP-binding protein
MNPVIEVRNLRKSYGSLVAVKDISFEVNEGEIFGLLGPNGAGKTTVVECIQGLRQPDSGHIRVLGVNPQTDKQDLRKHIGSQLQESALPDRIRVWEALDLFSSFVPGSPDWHILMDQWGLTAKQKASFGSLSGGQRQRLFVALALVNNPKVVFLDEMTTGLDPAARRTAWDLVREIRDRGTTVILVTHFMEEAEHLCDRIAIVNQGTIIASNSPQGLINAYAKNIRVTFSVEGETVASADTADLSWLEKIPGVHQVKKYGKRVEVEGEGPVLALVAAGLVNRGITPGDLHNEQPTLEDVFLTLTGSRMAG